MTPDPDPGFTKRKLTRVLIRMGLFVLLATAISALLRVAGLGPYLDTWWGSLVFMLLLYIPLFRFLTVDTFVPRRLTGQVQARQSGRQAAQSRAERRQERNRYAGVRKSPPRGGRR